MLSAVLAAILLAVLSTLRAPTLSLNVSSCPGHTLSALQEMDTGLAAQLKLASLACNVFGQGIPLSYTRISSLSPTPISTDNSTALDGSPLAFGSQYIQLASALPLETNIYGLGEVIASSGFRRDAGTEGGVGMIQKMWVRDVADPTDRSAWVSFLALEKCTMADSSLQPWFASHLHRAPLRATPNRREVSHGMKQVNDIPHHWRPYRPPRSNARDAPSSGMFALYMRHTRSRIPVQLKQPQRHEWKPRLHIGCHVCRPANAPYCSVAPCGLGPDK
ncbi:uncharacterized protein PHACADRAFT_189414 [Phanerochaete carnosa HHB-10118-sp]|uniref:Uncharacterized protein n=1 Tax=Phanerochaete carnosa (strain HHB-10118-sp) TaxID=650164 RepID=K5WLH9_PHACS|nr:uncharacterized protein PHACADRAFT_189414 [Phanerochaete carnosa HHB-10118-sp]EKM60280.1 hypothetical protein PHACADRAFT_189414 [Phanerochaete carnosa HHB-10118-sp]